jgi:murein DD-endopeptidase MepM/ murein hydrolase activator NlpD
MHAAPLLLGLLASVPSLELAPTAARPGDAVLVRVLSADAPPSGALAGRKLTFWRDGEEWRALAALPVETAPGKAPVRVRAGDAALGTDLEVVEPGFARHALTLAPRYVKPPASARKQMRADRKAFAGAFARPFEPPLFRGPFAWPRDDRKGGRFGDQRTLNGEKASVHYGIDLSGARGAPVSAAAGGVVALTRAAYMSGNTIVLWHGAGVFTVYFHLDRILVKEGDTVAQGQEIGTVGATGRATGPHLHWGVKVGGLYVDPESILAIDFERGAAPPRRPGPAAEAPKGEPPATAP